jgi:hypothetical protein
MSRRSLSVPALLALLVLSGCGSTSKSTPSGPAAATTTAGGSSAVQGTDDRAIARAGVLRLSDLPAGWTAGPRGHESTPAQIKNEAAACMHVSPALLAEPQPNEVQSPKFKDRAISASVENSVAVGPTEATASAYLRALGESQAPACLSSAFEKELEKSLSREAKKLPHGVSIGKLAVGTIPFPAEGSAHAAYRITLPITLNGVTVASYYIDAVLVQVGRAYMSMTFQASGAPLSSSIEEGLSKAAVGRLQKALGQ